ncbi:MAG: hypothetical protein ABH934_01595 [Chloroflexota bacterium]
MGVIEVLVTFLILLGLIGASVAGWIAPSPLPEPSPRWPLIVAYPALLLMILFLVAGLRLQFRIDSYEEKKAKLTIKLLPFPLDGCYFDMSEDNFRNQVGYAKIGITNRGGFLPSCIGTVTCISAVSGNGDFRPQAFTASKLQWDETSQYKQDIPGDCVERYLNLAYLNQKGNPGKWRLAIQNTQKQDYGPGWWKIDLTISSESPDCLNEPLEILIAIGLGDRKKPALPSGLNVQDWGKWHKSMLSDLK